MVFSDMHLVDAWSLMWCERSHTIWFLFVFGDLRLVDAWTLSGVCVCAAKPWEFSGFWRPAPCWCLKPYLVWVQPNHRSSQGFDELHLVDAWNLMWCECSQTIWNFRFWWRAPCWCLKPYVAWVQPNPENFQGFGDLHLVDAWRLVQPNHWNIRVSVIYIWFQSSDWEAGAQNQSNELPPQFIRPAIHNIEHSRAMRPFEGHEAFWRPWWGFRRAMKLS